MKYTHVLVKCRIKFLVETQHGVSPQVHYQIMESRNNIDVNVNNAYCHHVIIIFK